MASQALCDGCGATIKDGDILIGAFVVAEIKPKSKGKNPKTITQADYENARRDLCTRCCTKLLNALKLKE